MKTVKQRISEVEAAERALARAKADLEVAKRAELAKEPAKQLAVYLHAKLCRWNHTDGCSWHYFEKNGQHDWSEHSHARYLQQAQSVISRLKALDISEDKAYEVTKAILEKTR